MESRCISQTMSSTCRANTDEPKLRAGVKRQRGFPLGPLPQPQPPARGAPHRCRPLHLEGTSKHQHQSIATVSSALLTDIAKNLSNVEGVDSVRVLESLPKRVEKTRMICEEWNDPYGRIRVETD